MDGGYDLGYKSCPCFWGEKPGKLIANILQGRDVSGARVLDLGCGEGKNAAEFARRGALVTAIDCSEWAIANGRTAFRHLDIEWVVGDVLGLPMLDYENDYILMYGLLHCLASREQISDIIKTSIMATAPGGLHIIVTFNDRSQDLALAHPGFCPTLLPHEDYVRFYRDHDIIHNTDTILEEAHPHNGILHHHSITKIVAAVL